MSKDNGLLTLHCDTRSGRRVEYNIGHDSALYRALAKVTVPCAPAGLIITPRGHIILSEVIEEDISKSKYGSEYHQIGPDSYQIVKRSRRNSGRSSAQSLMRENMLKALAAYNRPHRPQN